jgi:predicted 3-demethylubiquinone-9 3-methyltransferase (glyoxalase superfamily)
MAVRATTFLMFEGKAEEAMNFYVSLIPGSRVISVQRYGAGEPVAEGSVKLAKFQVGGQEFTCFNSPVKHAFTFTPAISIFLDCESEAEVDMLYAKLAEGGQTLMPLDAYPFSKKFGWVVDRYGVSWQLNFV